MAWSTSSDCLVSGRSSVRSRPPAPGPIRRNARCVEVAEKRNPRASATVDQLLARYLEQFDGAPNTLRLYRGHVPKHFSPFLGQLKVGELDADVLGPFYAELRRCRDHCGGRRTLQHRTKRSHECDERCRPHVCRPLAARPCAAAEFEQNVRRMYEQMARIAITPNWARFYDFGAGRMPRFLQELAERSRP